MPRFLFLFLILFILEIPVRAQDDYLLRAYSTDNGMPSNGIKGMQWDSTTDLLWIATEAGVVRFNGFAFKNYTRDNVARMTSDRTIFMVRNLEGKIFVADQDKNVFSIRKNKLEFLESSVQNDQTPGNLFLIAASTALYNHNREAANTNAFYLPFDIPVAISDSACYMHQGNSVFYYSYHLQKKLNFQTAKEGISSIFRIGPSIFVKDLPGQLYRMVTESMLVPVNLIDEEGHALQLSGQDHTLCWENGMEYPVLIVGNRAWLLTEEGQALRAKLIASNVPVNVFIRFVQYSESRKLLFIGTDSKGLFVISHNRVQAVKKAGAGLKERNAYYGQIELDNGTILTNEGHIIGQSKLAPSEVPVGGAFLLSAFRTDSLLWYCRQPGPLGGSILYSFNYANGHTKEYSRISTMMGVAKSGGKIYLANQDGFGIVQGDSIKFLQRFSSLTYDIKEVSPGILFLANCRGLLRFDTRTQVMDTVAYVGECVRSLWQYKDYVFFGTYGKGFFVWHNGVIRSMPLDKNKYLLYTHCFIEDNKGFVWMSTNRGLFKANIKELVNAFGQTGSQVYYHYFGKNDGMDITEMNGGCAPCALRLKSGMLSFPTMDGLLWVNPDQAIPVLSPGKIYIDEFLVNDRSIDPDSVNNSLLPASSKEIVIKLGYSTWGNRENLYIDYQLNDTLHWKPLGGENEAVIRLSNLPSGSYELRMRKVNGFGIGNYSYKSISFTIETPWYQQWWFYLLVAAVVIGLFYLILKWRIRHSKQLQYKLEKQVAGKTRELQEKNEVLEKANSIKTRLISIISHDIITPLKFVTVAGKNLLEKRKQMPEELQSEALQEIANTAQEVQLLSTNILNWIKYQNENRRLVKEDFNVCDLVDSVFGVLKSLATQQGLKLSNHVEKELVIEQFYEPLKILVYNLVSNAINFSDKGSITITSKEVAGGILLSIQDEGMGMTQEQIRNIYSNEFIISSANVDKKKGNGLGFLIIKDLLKMMNASFEIKSKKGEGTVVTVDIPV
jgi:signal transduction histidine kinase